MFRWWSATGPCWQDFAGTIPAADGLAVARVDDLTGGGDHLLGDDPGDRPLFELAGLNGLPILARGENRTFLFTSLIILLQSQFTLLGVFRVSSMDSSDVICVNGDLGGLSEHWYMRGFPFGNNVLGLRRFILFGQDVVSSDNPAVPGFGTIVFESDDVSGQVLAAGDFSGEQPWSGPLAGVDGSFSVGTSGAGAFDGLFGDFCELLLYVPRLSEVNRDLARTYLRDKWAVT